jgi:hypothetical protein
MTGGTASCEIRRRDGALVGIELNHTIVRVRDKRESAQFVAEILGLGDPRPFGPFQKPGPLGSRNGSRERSRYSNYPFELEPLYGIEP